jgi:hypothetical protein
MSSRKYAPYSTSKAHIQAKIKTSPPINSPTLDSNKKPPFLNVAIVLDISGSMKSEGEIQDAKKASIEVQQIFKSVDAAFNSGSWQN